MLSRLHPRIRFGTAILVLGAGALLSGCHDRAGRLDAKELSFRDIFVDPIAAGPLLDKFLRGAVESVHDFEQGTSLNIRARFVTAIDSFVMPNAGYPGKELPIVSKLSLMRLPSNWQSIFFEFRSIEEENLFVGVEERTHSVQVKAGVTQVFVVRRKDNYRLCTQDECRWMEGTVGISDWNLGSLELSGSGAVSNVQVYGKNGLLAHENFENRDGARIRENDPGYQTLQWSFASRYAVGLALQLGVLAEICRPEHRLNSQCPGADYHARARAALGSLLHHVATWPSWRPARADAPQAGPQSWMRGDWANGLLPLAVALSALALRDELSPSQWNELAARVEVSATRWLTHESFPTLAHWRKRSTNHGTFIYGGAGAAALILSNCRPSEGAKKVIDGYFSLMKAGTGDGAYLEGPGYVQVFLYSGLFLPWIESHCMGKKWTPYVERRMTFLPKLAEFVRAASDTRGRILANFGDSDQGRWQEGVLRLLGISDLDGDPSIPWGGYLSLVLPPGKSRMEPTLRCSVFPENGFAAAHIRRGDGSATFAFISTRYQQTHNKDVDINSLFLETNGTYWMVEDRETHKQAAFTHNAIAIKGMTLLDSANPWSSCGTPGCGQRKVNGGLITHQITPESCQFTGEVSGPYLRDDHGAPVIVRYRRAAYFVNAESPLLLLVDMVRLATDRNSETVLATLNLPNTSDVHLDATVARVRGMGSLNFPQAVRLMREKTARGVRLYAEYPGDSSTRLFATLIELGESFGARKSAVIRTFLTRSDGFAVHVQSPSRMQEIQDRTEFEGIPVHVRLYGPPISSGGMPEAKSD